MKILLIDLMCKDTQLGYEMARNAKVRWRTEIITSLHQCIKLNCVFSDKNRMFSKSP